MIRNFFFTTLVLLLSGAIFSFTITQLDPLGAQGNIALASFFISLFSGVGSLMTLIFFFGAEVWASQHLGAENFKRAVRRGVLLGAAVSGIMGMQLFSLLGWLPGGLLLIFLALIELIFLSSRKK